MRLLDRLAAPQARAALPVNDFATFMSQTWTGSKDVESVQATFASYAADGYGGNGVVYACILARLQLFAQAEFKFQNLADKRLYGTPRAREAALIRAIQRRRKLRRRTRRSR